MRNSLSFDEFVAKNYAAFKKLQVANKPITGGTLAIASPIRCAHVYRPGFKTLFVRCAYRFGFPTFDIATVETRERNKGLFTSLVYELRRRCQEFGTYVECVQSLRFGEGLKRMGFDFVGESNYYQWPMLADPKLRTHYKTTLNGIRQLPHTWYEAWGISNGYLGNVG